MVLPACLAMYCFSMEKLDTDHPCQLGDFCERVIVAYEIKMQLNFFSGKLSFSSRGREFCSALFVLIK